MTMTNPEDALLRKELQEVRDELITLRQANARLQQECERLRAVEQAYVRLREAYLALQKQGQTGWRMPDAGTERAADVGDMLAHDTDMPWSRSDAFLSEAVRYIRDNIDDTNLSIETFARHMNISRSMLYRRIKAATGLTPVELVHRIRITQSIKLLRSDYNFSQIAYMTGFNDPKYFTKCFKRYTGVTPSRWREMRRRKGAKEGKDILSHDSSYRFGNYLVEDLYW